MLRVALCDRWIHEHSSSKLISGYIPRSDPHQLRHIHHWKVVDCVPDDVIEFVTRRQGGGKNQWRIRRHIVWIGIWIAYFALVQRVNKLLRIAAVEQCGWHINKYNVEWGGKSRTIPEIRIRRYFNHRAHIL